MRRSYSSRRKRRNRKKRNSFSMRRRNMGLMPVIILSALLVVVLILIIILVFFNPFKKKEDPPEINVNESKIEVINESAQPAETTAPAQADDAAQTAIAKARRAAAMYDYDAALEMIAAIPDYAANPDCISLTAEIGDTKARLIKWSDNTKISHLRFHTLIADTALAFDGDQRAASYAKTTVTVTEFKNIIQKLYEKGFVLVGMHDIAELETAADGSAAMKQKAILLPAGKTPIVISQDDLNYYRVTAADGFATKLVLEGGKIKCEMNGREPGDYDIVPILDAFIEEHPDFSYHGSKGVLAVTGYEGVFGYRTSDTHFGPDCAANDPLYAVPNANIEEDKKKAAEVAGALKAEGWEIAMHGWNHASFGSARTYESLTADVELWKKEVEPIVGKTDILIYPTGEDIGSFRLYTDAERQTELTLTKYEYLKNSGFNYFCNIDASTPYWVQISGSYLRQGRLNVDGRMFKEILSGQKNRLEHLLSNEEIRAIVDPIRPAA
ncbi:MAG: polysaccharide deacetylase [Lachnospiraceae bacterium]|nr:polysaccharide deacetylase [Lachnospiraceae bacterium]